MIVLDAGDIDGLAQLQREGPGRDGIEARNGRAGQGRELIGGAGHEVHAMPYDKRSPHCDAVQEPNIATNASSSPALRSGGSMVSPVAA